MKDPRERHIVCKLDRYELEDRYLRLLEEVNSLKKLSNNQEDKIKRLATKLMRYGANPRTCIASINVTNDREKLSLLEAENSKLRNKMCVLRNQLVNNKIFTRSPPRGRRLGSTSGLITCRSEGSRLKVPSCQCISARPGNDENDVQNYSLKIQEMEKEKKEMLCRIADLETELGSYSTSSRREKVAENVEYIRVWRKMQRQNEKLVDTQSVNEILNEQVYQLKNRLEECEKNNVEVAAALETERMQSAQLNDGMSRIRDSEVDLREKNERIMDLTKEMEILQQHNRELVELSAKFNKVEKENAEYKRKIAEQASEYQVLKNNLSKEKANMAALQAANDQLLAKLHDLQKNIDLMTIKLMAQNEKHSNTQTKKINKKSNSASSSEELSTTNKEAFKINAETFKKNSDDVKTRKPDQREKGIQAGDKFHLINETTQTDNLLDSAKLEDKASVDFIEKYDRTKMQIPRNGNSLSREEMLKLLEQVQINTPLESQIATRMRHSGTATLSAKAPRQVSKLETMLFGESNF